MKKAPKNNGSLPLFASAQEAQDVARYVAAKQSLRVEIIESSGLVPRTDWTAPNLSDLPDWSRYSRIAVDSEFSDPTLTTLGIGARRGAKICGISFATPDKRSWYVPIRHPRGNVENPEKAIQYFQDQSKNFKGELVGANLNVDLDLMHYEGIRFNQSEVMFRDIQIAGPLIWELHHSYSLESEAARWGFMGKNEVGLKKVAACYGADTTKRGWKSIIPQLPASHVGTYAEHDAAILLPVLEAQEAEMKRQNLLEVWDLESRLLPVLLKIRQRGVAIDWQKLEQVEVFTLSEEKKTLDEIYSLTGIRIPVGTIMQKGPVAEALMKLGYKLGKTDTGEWCVTTEVLAAIDHPVAKLIRYCRQAYKIRTTFVKSIREHATNGRIHGTMKQIVGSNDKNEKTGAAFGRLSHCIAAGTLVRTADGLKPIESIQVGDQVQSYDCDLLPCERKVLWAGKTGTKKVVRLHWHSWDTGASGFVDMTPEHLVRLPDGEYREAQFLKKDDVIIGHGRHEFDVPQVVALEELPAEVDVYDLEIEDTHNFIAGEICVHNCSPNSAQQPSSGPFAAMWRSIYVPEPGCKWGVVDFSANEPRWIVHFAEAMRCAGAAEMAEQYRTNERIDPHGAMAQLTGLERKYAKIVFLALAYGEGGAKMCNHQLKLPTRWKVKMLESGETRYFESEEEATAWRKERVGKARINYVAGEQGQGILDTFNQRAPFLRELADVVQKRIEEVGQIRLLGGRVLHFPIGRDGSYDWAYKGLNRLIQGSAGYQIKLSMIRLSRDMPDTWIQAQRHDDLAGSFSSVKEIRQVSDIMSSVVKARVPWRTDIEMGTSDGDIHQMCADRSCEKHAVADKIGKYWCENHQK